MRGGSIWYIAVMGVLGFALVSLFMLFALETFQDSPAGNRAKLALEVKKEFKFDVVAAHVDPGNPPVLRIEYQTSQDSGFDQNVMDEEMQMVGLFAINKYSDRKIKKEEFGEILVVRYEIRGSGCFQETYSSELTVENPHKPDDNPFDFDD